MPDEIDQVAREWAQRFADLMNEINDAEYGIHTFEDFDGTGAYGIHPFNTGRRVADIAMDGELKWQVR